MCAAENEGVDVGIRLEKGIDVFFHEIVGTVAVGLAVFNKRHPHRACMAVDRNTGRMFCNFDIIRLRGYCSRSGEEAYRACSGGAGNGFYRRADYAEHSPRGVYVGEVALLYAAQGLGRGRVAGQYDQRASLFEKMFDGFESESVDELERARAVWSRALSPRYRKSAPGSARRRSFNMVRPPKPESKTPIGDIRLGCWAVGLTGFLG